MRGCTKLKIIINKMTDFINNLVDIVLEKRTKILNNYRYNYFHNYSENIDLLNDNTLTAIYDIIERSSNEIDTEMIKDISYFLSCDISNETVVASTKNIKNYIIFSLYMSLIDIKVRRMYFNKKIIVNIVRKLRPDKYLCEIMNYKNDFQLYAYAKSIVDLPLVKDFETKILALKELNGPMPFFDVIDNMIIYEKPSELNPNKDALLDVLKDIVNQLKFVNINFWFEYIDKCSIGRSQNGLCRYFIFFLDSLISHQQHITSYNVYDGRRKYDTISCKDQIRTIIHILSEIYVTGGDNYIEKCKIEPFAEYLRVLDNLVDEDIHDNFILYLMNIKNEGFKELLV
tara:strand:+ start:419 stop:1447 length:1029 start_codon:yes stop_codon:yes gene_type:complete